MKARLPGPSRGLREGAAVTLGTQTSPRNLSAQAPQVKAEKGRERLGTCQGREGVQQAHPGLWLSSWETLPPPQAGVGSGGSQE